VAQLVQFTGITKVIEAFQNRECRAWSVWSGRQLLFTCVGINSQDAALELQTLLESLDRTGNGIYTLKVYEDLKKAEKITEKTPAHGSFNYRLSEYDQESTNWYKQFQQENKELKAELQTLKEELDAGPEDEEKNALGYIEMFLEDPAKLPLIVQSIQSVLNMFTTQTKMTGQQITPAPITISGISGPDPLQSAIEVLKAKDPNLTRHLQKLAQIATNDPEGFKYLLTVIDGIK